MFGQLALKSRSTRSGAGAASRSYPVATMCRVLEVSSSGYWAWSKRPPSARACSDAELTSEEGRGFFQDLPLGAKGPVLAPQPHELSALIARETLGLAGIDLGLDDPAAERLVADAEIPRHLPRGVARLPGQAHGLGPELRWVRCCSSWHVDSLVGGSMPPLSSVHGTGSTPEPARM